MQRIRAIPDRLIGAIAKSFLKIVAFIFRLMPRETSLAVGRLLGRLFYLVVRKRREIALRNLELAFGKEKGRDELRSLALRSFESLFMNFVELFSLSHLDSKTLESIMDFEGEEVARDILAGGKGALVLSAHLGNWDLFGAAMALKGYPVAFLTKGARIRSINDLWMDYRRSTGIIFFSGKGSMRDILRHLQRGGAVCFVLDQNTLRSQGVFVPFFGKDACTLSSLAILAKRTGVPVVPAYTFRSGSRHKAVIEKPLPEASIKEGEDEIIAKTRQYTMWIEKIIRALFLVLMMFLYVFTIVGYVEVILLILK